MIKTLLKASVIAVGAATCAMAQDREAVTYAYDGSYDEALFSVETAILGRGLVIDFVSHVGDMLNRTAADVGSDFTIFDEAQIFVFCSAVVSRQVMEAEPANIVHCPYGIYVAERDGAVTIGHRAYPEGPMQQVETLLSDIVTEALEE